MKTLLFAALLLFAPSLSLADGPAGGWDGNYLSFLDLPADKQPKEFGVLLSSGVPSRRAAEDLALGAWGRQIRAYQLVRVVGLYRAAEVGGVGVAGFAAPGHWVWEVHIGPLPGLNGIILIDAQTKEVRQFPTDAKP